MPSFNVGIKHLGRVFGSRSNVIDRYFFLYIVTYIPVNIFFKLIRPITLLDT